MLQFDAGDMLWGRASVTARERPQREIKADLLLAANQLLGVDALGPSDGDLAFGLDFLVEGARKYDLPYVSANLARTGGELVFPATRVIEHQGRRIGVTSLMPMSHPFAGVELLPHKESLEGAVASLREQGVELIVLLSGAGLDETRALVEVVEGVDIVLCSHTRKHQTDPVIVGRTAIFEAGSRGKHLGKVDIEFREGGVGWSNEEGRERALRSLESVKRQLDRYDEQLAAATDVQATRRLERLRRMTQQRYDGIFVPPEDDGTTHTIRGSQAPMDKGLGDEPAMKALVDAALAKLGDAPAAAGSGEARKEYGDFVGASTCLACHKEQYTDWKQTGHARAYKALVADQRQFDDDCWSCHVTGAGAEGGPAGPKEVGPMRNVQCESCHGPGRAHSTNPEKVDMQPGNDEKLCLACHTEEQTEGSFVLDEYLPKVAHVATQ